MVAFLYGWMRSEAIQLGRDGICIEMGKMDGLCIINSLYPFFTHFAQDEEMKGRKGSV